MAARENDTATSAVDLHEPSAPHYPPAPEAPAPPTPRHAGAAADNAVYTERTQPGHGGELHQQPGPDQPTLTTSQGQPLSDGQNSLTAGEAGPTLLEDFALRDKIFHFDHERIPERVVHARGYGAHGTFTAAEDLSDLTCASVFAKAGKQTPVFVRFSTVAGNLGSFDLARDVRGFATKFYTDEGNWDLVGNNIPVFFIQDALKFPDLIHAVKEEQDRGWPQAQSAHDTFWDFAGLMPESTHMLMWQMSDRAIPRSFRFMQGFGVHTFRFVDKDGRSTFVKFHWVPRQGLQSVVWNEAVKINGADPDFHRKDLWQAITNGDLPEWDLAVQTFDDEFADQFEFDVLDATKLIPEEQVPLRVIGTMRLERTVDNVFSETEQVAFCTQNIVPGIDFTNDPLLQGRNFSYLDTQLKRLGSPNFSQLPVNAPRCPVAHFQRDGHMQTGRQAGRATYEPNSFTGAAAGPRADAEKGFRSAERPVSGDTRRIRPESFADHYSQAGQFWRSQSAVEQQHIRMSFVFELSKCEIPQIRTRVVANLRNVDEELAAAVADGLGMELPEATEPHTRPNHDLPASPALSMTTRAPESFAGRKLGILVSDGVDAGVLDGLQQTFEQGGALVETIGLKVGGVTLADGERRTVDHTVAGAPSVLFDAVALLGAGPAAEQLAGHPATRDFVADAFSHYKVIGHLPGARAMLEAGGIADSLDEACLDLESVTPQEFLDACAELRRWARDV
ncbi:catalase [Serinicoccus kebangsaanensis]|uniref:catalase n=1 Tax=Serinicoccus kebangsaanensis TaxID=2602069 RepID=UPI00124E7BF8|nr:catalase [Serinicoccus kebangsaanensis]